MEDKELITKRTWTGDTGWGGIWGRSSIRERRVYAAIMVVWFFVVVVYGGFRLIAG